MEYLWPAINAGIFALIGAFVGGLLRSHAEYRQWKYKVRLEIYRKFAGILAAALEGEDEILLRRSSADYMQIEQQMYWSHVYVEYAALVNEIKLVSQSSRLLTRLRAFSDIFAEYTQNRGLGDEKISEMLHLQSEITVHMKEELVPTAHRARKLISEKLRKWNNEIRMIAPVDAKDERDWFV